MTHLREIASRARAAAAAATLLLGLAGGAASGAPIATADNGVDALMTKFDQCASAEGNANLVILMDESASLADSDSGAQRAVAAGQFAQQLSEYADSDGVNIGVKVAGFAGDYSAGDWLEVTGPDDAAALQAQIRDRGTAQDGRETDYWNALQGAAKDLAAAPSKCRMLLFFTDGEYDVDGSYGNSKPYTDKVVTDKTGPAVEAAGKASICSDKQGPLNRLRAAGAQLVVVGLTGTGKDKSDLSFAQAMALGTDYDGQPCGTPREPGESAFLEVADASALVFALGSLTGGDLHSSNYTGGLAQIDFGLDSYIGSASVLADSGTVLGDVRIGLAGPDGTTSWADEKSGQLSVAGAVVNYEVLSGRTSRFVIDLPDSGESAAGTWSVRYQARKDDELPADALAQAKITVTADLKPTWTNAVTQAVAGDPLPVTVSITSAGKPLAQELPNAKLAVAFRSADGTTTDLATGTPAEFSGGRDVPLVAPDGQPLTPGAGKLVFRLDVTTVAQPPTQLKQAVASYPLTLAAPADYPTVDTTELQLRDADGNIVASGLTQSVGAVSVTGPGCVWLDLDATEAALSALPDGSSDAALTAAAASSDSCVEVAEGKSAQVPFTVAPDAPGNGVIAGSLVVMAAPEAGTGGSAQPIAVPVAFSAQREKLLNPPVMWATFLLGLLLGLGIPAALLFGVRRRSARIVVADPLAGYLSYATKDFTVRDGAVVDPATGAPVGINAKDVRAVSVTAGSSSLRTVEVAGSLLTAQAWGNPFRAPDVRVTRTGSAELLSDDARPPSRAARLPLAVQGHWVAWADGTGAGHLLMLFSSNDASDEGLRELTEALQEGLAGRVDALAGLIGSAAPGTAGGTPGQDPHGSDDWAVTTGESPDW